MDSNAYFFTAEDDQPCWADNVKGWFAIPHTELTLPAFENSKKAEIFQLIHPRNNLNKNTEGWGFSTEGFDVSGPCFYEAKTFSSDDFVIMADELDILINGGMKIDLFGLADESARIKNVVTESVGNKTLTSMAKLIKSLLYLCYKDEDVINNPESTLITVKVKSIRILIRSGLNFHQEKPSTNGYEASISIRMKSGIFQECVGIFRSRDIYKGNLHPLSISV
jgi:hypothetical protein